MSSGEWAPLPGMADLFSPESELWHAVEEGAREVFSCYGVREIRTPILERTSVFARALGEGTDVVQKEMFSFEDRGGRLVSLRPEGTAGVIRALLRLGAAAGERVFYMGPMFRAERPQAGRRRQFHQVGVELLGPPSPMADAECVALMAHLFERWGLGGVKIRVFTRGRSADHPSVREGLLRTLEPHEAELCAECQRRRSTHPLRILDCKVAGCRTVVERLPPMTGFMSAESRGYLEEVSRLLERLGVPAETDARLIRGLDYYEHTIWEATHPALGAQDAVAGGGRYRIEIDGGVVEGVGFAVGLERVILALSGGDAERFARRPTVWLVAVGDRAREENLVWAQELRRGGVACGLDLAGRSVKAQMRAADRSRAVWVAVRGDDELAAAACRLKNMATGEETVMPVAEATARLRAGA